MLSSLLLTALFATAAPQEPTDSTLSAPVELESVTILSERSDYSVISSSQIVLPAAELTRFDIIDGNTLLQAQPGVYTQQEDGWGLRLNIGIRGTGVERSSRITLMEDGILTAPAAYSAPAAYYSPVLWNYQQIEILKGAAALISGPQSTGGAINFVTPTPQEKDYTVMKTSAGSFGNLIGNLLGQYSPTSRGTLIYGFQQNGAEGFNQIGQQTLGGFQLSDGFVKYVQHLDDRDQHHLEVFLAGTRERSNQTYLGQTQEDALSNPNGRYLASELDSMAMERLMGRIGYTLNSKNGWFRADVYRQYVHRNWYKLDRISDGATTLGIGSILSNPGANPTFLSALQGSHSSPFTADLKANNRYYLSQGLQLKSQYTLALNRGYIKTEAGARIHWDRADRFQHRNTYTLSDTALHFLAAGELGAAGNRIDAASAQSAYIRSTFHRGAWDLQAGVRTEFITSSRTDWGSADSDRLGTDLSERSNQTLSILPGISANREFEQWSVFASLHQGMTPAGSKEGVLPEFSTNGEMGLVHNQLPISFVAYHSAYNRLLGSDAASSGGSGTGELFNGGAAQISGLEFQMEHSYKGLTATATGTYTRAIFTESFASEFDGWGDVEQGDILPYLPALQANLTLDYQYKKWSASFGLNGLGARKSSASLDEHDLPAAVVANAALRYDVSKHWSLKCSGQNLTNTRHIVAARPAGFRTFTPRMWTVGAELSL